MVGIVKGKDQRILKTKVPSCPLLYPCVVFVKERLCIGRTGEGCFTTCNLTHLFLVSPIIILKDLSIFFNLYRNVESGAITSLCSIVLTTFINNNMVKRLIRNHIFKKIKKQNKTRGGHSDALQKFLRQQVLGFTSQKILFTSKKSD